MSQKLSTGQWIFNFTFDLAIRFVLLNVIRGITVDTFSELRIAKILRLKDTLETCFICGLHKQVFDRDRRSHGFVHHIRHEHNMWNYLYFIIYLWEQDKDDDDGLEQYVRRSIEKGDINWIPTNKAMGLSAAALSDASSSHTAGGDSTGPGTGLMEGSTSTSSTTRREFQKYLMTLEHSLIHRLNEFQAMALMRSNHVKNELNVMEETLGEGPSTWRSLSYDGSFILRNDSVTMGGTETAAAATQLSSPVPAGRNRLTVKKNFPRLTIQILEINGFDFPSCIYDTSISCVIRCTRSISPQIIDSQHIYHSVEEETRKKNSVVHFPPNSLVELVRAYQPLSRINSQSVVIQITRSGTSIPSQQIATARRRSVAQLGQGRIFVGSIRLSIGELIGHLDTAVEKTFSAQVLGHECEGILTFIPSLSAVVVDQEAVSPPEEKEEEEEED
jgi:hypothetical protein